MNFIYSYKFRERKSIEHGCGTSVSEVSRIILIHTQKWKTKHGTKLYRRGTTHGIQTSLRFHGFLLAQLVPLLKHGRLECTVLSFLRRELG
jgi:hypothetical protein